MNPADPAGPHQRADPAPHLDDADQMYGSAPGRIAHLGPVQQLAGSPREFGPSI